MTSATNHVLTEIAAMLALVAPAAWAGSETVEFHGAVVAPTCTVEPAAPTESPAATASAALQTCPSKTGSTAVGYFTATHAPVSGIASDPLLDYFEQAYKPTGENAGKYVVTRVYQ